MCLYDFTNLRLMRFNRQSGIDDGETAFRYQLFVLFDDASLKHPEAVLGVVAQTQIQTGLVVFEAVASAHQAPNCGLQRNAEVERDRWFDGKSIKIANPFAVHPAGHIASKCGIDITIAKHYGARLQERENASFSSIGKIRCVNKGEGRWSEQFLFLAQFTRIFH